jgi:hypothetical protein
MTGVIDPKVYAACPNLAASDHSWSSPETKQYNCIAYAVGDSQRWWQPLTPDQQRLLPPFYFWPRGVRRGDYSVANYIRAYQTLGYTACGMNGDLEPGFAKVVLYELDGRATHAAMQLPNGDWSSKAGPFQDFCHAGPDAVAGGLYGNIAVYMRRQLPRPKVAKAARK